MATFKYLDSNPSELIKYMNMNYMKIYMKKILI